MDTQVARYANDMRGGTSASLSSKPKKSRVEHASYGTKSLDVQEFPKSVGGSADSWNILENVPSFSIGNDPLDFTPLMNMDTYMGRSSPPTNAVEILPIRSTHDLHDTHMTNDYGQEPMNPSPVMQSLGDSSSPYHDDTELPTTSSATDENANAATAAMIDASNGRKNRGTGFFCSSPGCPASFTNDYSKKRHERSHSSVSPYSYEAAVSLNAPYLAEKLHQDHNIPNPTQLSRSSGNLQLSKDFPPQPVRSSSALATHRHQIRHHRPSVSEEIFPQTQTQTPSTHHTRIGYRDEPNLVDRHRKLVVDTSHRFTVHRIIA